MSPALCEKQPGKSTLFIFSFFFLSLSLSSKYAIMAELFRRIVVVFRAGRCAYEFKIG